VDYRDVDERTREGAVIIGELIGIQSLLMEGKGATRVARTPELKKKESIGNAKTFRFNSSNIAPRGNYERKLRKI